MKFFKWLATLGPIGYLPAPGTCASVVALGLVCGCHLLHIPFVFQVVLMTGLSGITWFAVCRSLVFFKEHDPSEIVVDELIGCLIACMLVPFSALSLGAAFVLFRFFDIFKPLGIKKLEQISGSWGIVLDDIVAGLLSTLLVQFMYAAGIM